MRIDVKIASKCQLWATPFSGLIGIIVFSQRSISSKTFLTNCLNLISKQLVNREQPPLISLNQGVFCDKSSSWVLGTAAAYMLVTLNTNQQTKGGNLHRPECFQALLTCTSSMCAHTQTCHSSHMLICTTKALKHTMLVRHKAVHYPMALDSVINFLVPSFPDILE